MLRGKTRKGGGWVGMETKNIKYNRYFKKGKRDWQMKMSGMGEVTEAIKTTVIDDVYDIYELIVIADYA